MYFYVLTNFYNHKLYFGYTKNQSTLVQELRKNKKFKARSRQHFSKVVYWVKVPGIVEAEALLGTFLDMKRSRIDEIITSFNPEWEDILHPDS